MLEPIKNLNIGVCIQLSLEFNVAAALKSAFWNVIRIDKILWLYEVRINNLEFEYNP